MITPFRMIKNEFLRNHKFNDDFFNYNFVSFVEDLERYFLSQYNILNNDISANRILEIDRFANDFLNIENIDDFLVTNNLINKDEKIYYFIPTESRIFYSYHVFCNTFDEIKSTLTRKKINLCFNLTPIREPQ